MRVASGSRVMRLTTLLVLLSVGILYNTRFFHEAAIPANHVVPLRADGTHPPPPPTPTPDNASFFAGDSSVLIADGTHPPPPPAPPTA